MPVTVDDLWLINADATDRAKLDKALDYIQTAMPLNGAPVVEAIAREPVQIAINHVGNMTYDASTRTINWDPDVGMTVQDNEGEFAGVNSSASILLHEMNHASDPDYQKNLESPNSEWRNDAERYANYRTNEALKEAGEPTRVNQKGDLMRAPDPTEHTEHWEHFDEPNFGEPTEFVWVEMDSLSSLDVFGDVFEMSDLLYGMPSIGGSPWGPFLPEIGPDSTASPAAEAMAADTPVTLVGTPDAQYHDSFMFM